MLIWSAPDDARIRVTVFTTQRASQVELIRQLLPEKLLLLALQEAYTTTEALMQKLTEEQNIQAANLPEVRYLLILNCDQAQPAVLAVFVRQLLAQDAALHIVLSGRDTSISVTGMDDELAGQTRLFPQDRLLSEERRLLQNTLEVRAFGPGQVISQGRVIEDWKGDLMRNLFFFLLNRPIMRRGDISQAFWKNRTLEEGINLFHVTRLRLKHLLGIELLHYERGYYRLSPKIHLIYDVNDFLDLIERSKAAPEDEAVTLLEAAVKLYRDSYHTWLDEEAAGAIRARCEEEFGDALMRLACVWYMRGDIQRSLAMLARASRVQMGRDDITAKLMEVGLHLGQPGDAIRAYQRLEAFTIASAGTFQPPDELRRLFNQAQASLPACYR